MYGCRTVSRSARDDGPATRSEGKRHARDFAPSRPAAAIRCLDLYLDAVVSLSGGGGDDEHKTTATSAACVGTQCYPFARSLARSLYFDSIERPNRGLAPVSRRQLRPIWKTSTFEGYLHTVTDQKPSRRERGRRAGGRVNVAR